jgi:cysteine-rich repeat protein
MTRALSTLLFLFAAACDRESGETDTSVDPSAADADSDGFPASVDCDDANPDVHPNKPEACNDADDDCDGEVDEQPEGGAAVWADADGDGFGSGPPLRFACEAGEGEATVSGDCDDTDPAVQGGAAEACDGEDNDCDGQIDEDVTGAPTWYRDADGDGHGDAEATMTACAQPEGYVDTSDDCDDLDASAMPGGTEACGGGDEDCDGEVDEAGATGESTYYTDIDEDGYGDANAAVTACVMPAGASYRGDDCDDAASDIYPTASETCDGLDQDCDGQIDDAARDALVWYLDADADGEGRDTITVRACDAPEGFVDNSRDCDDLNDARNSTAAETCNGVDDDCDGTRDEGHPLRAAYMDADGDGLGAGSPIQVCAAPPGYVDEAGDCDDADDMVSPDVEEVCDDGRDDDCDGDADCDQDSCRMSEPTCFECGDGFVQGTEQCDDGNNVDNDGCRNNCTVDSGCSSLAMDKIQIAPDLWLCSLDRVYGGNTWVQTYSVCNQAGGFNLPSVTSITRRGLPTDAQIASGMNAARALGFDYVVTGQPTRSCSWDSNATSYESCNGLGYVNTSEVNRSGSNWVALSDGNGADRRNWPAANTTNVHTLISMCYQGNSGRGDVLFDHRWR